MKKLLKKIWNNISNSLDKFNKWIHRDYLSPEDIRNLYGQVNTLGQPIDPRFDAQLRLMALGGNKTALGIILKSKDNLLSNDNVMSLNSMIFVRYFSTKIAYNELDRMYNADMFEPEENWLERRHGQCVAMMLWEFIKFYGEDALSQETEKLFSHKFLFINDIDDIDGTDSNS